MDFETVIGLEVHAQLSTQTKIFSGAPTAFGADVNTQACAIDIGLPGVLPVLNREVVRLAVCFGLSVDAQISHHSVFARKNYFYPDLPKGYQITQYEWPIVINGHIDIDVNDSIKRIRIVRAHLEEDAGKSLHHVVEGYTGIDLNRAGVPLLEIVSAPDLRSAQEAIAYVKTLHDLVQYIGICDGNMQEGSFRFDVNVSIRPLGDSILGTRTEIKNLNSFRFMERAIAYEVARQKSILTSGGVILQETRLYDPDRDETRPMRSKEDAHDYRYFPDPDLLPIELTDAFINDIRDQLPELPLQKRARFKKEYDLSDHHAAMLTTQREMADYFENTVNIVQAMNASMNLSIMPKSVAHWIVENKSVGHLLLYQTGVLPAHCAVLLARVADQTISNTAAKVVFEAMLLGEADVDAVIARMGLHQISDDAELKKIVHDVVNCYPQQVQEYRAGKEKLIAFFVGHVMKMTQGKANPSCVNRLLMEQLKK